MKRKPLSEEHKKKMSEIMLEKWKDPEFRRKNLEAKQAAMKPRTQEHKDKIAEKMKEYWADPEYREKTRKSQSEGAKARWADPEKRAALLRARGQLKDDE